MTTLLESDPAVNGATYKLAELLEQRDALKRAKDDLGTDSQSREAQANTALDNAGKAAATGSPIRKILDGLIGGRNPLLGGRDREVIGGIAAKLDLRLLDIDDKIAKAEAAHAEAVKVARRRGKTGQLLNLQDRLPAAFDMITAFVADRDDFPGLGSPVFDGEQVETAIRFLQGVLLENSRTLDGIIGQWTGAQENAARIASYREELAQ